MSKKSIFQSSPNISKQMAGKDMPLANYNMPFLGISLSPITLNQSKDFIK